MNNLKRLGVSFISLVCVAVFAVQIDDVPPHATNTVLHNLMLVVDDSGSMDYELMTSALEGSLWWNEDNRNFVGSSGEINYSGRGAANKFTMLFPNGYSSTYNGQRLNTENGALPFLNAYAFARSSHFNGIYYDPSVNYQAWPSRGGYFFSDSTPTAARYDPLFSDTIDLTQEFSTSAKGADYAFSVRQGMECSNTGQNCNYDGKLHQRYFPATYFIKRTTGHFFSNLAKTQQHSCALGAEKPSNYQNYLANPGHFSSVDALAPDGSCLEKVEIKPSSAPFASGRSYAQEIQNFANWFTYYRRRHQTMRGALARSLNGMSAFRAGIFWINEHTPKVSIYDMNNATEASALFRQHYDHIGSATTPLKSSLYHAGMQYKRTDANAPIVNSCQQNFTLLFTDGFADKESIIGVTNEDAFAGTPYNDLTAGTLADIAYRFYKTPLRTDLNDGYEVQTSLACENGTAQPWEDCAKYPHMKTYTIGLGATGNYFGKTHFNIRDAYENPPVWPTNLNRRDKNQVDDLYHAAVNGRGEAYSAQSPQELEASLKETMTTLSNGASKGNRVTFSAASANDSTLFSAVYRNGNWTGQLSAYDLNDGQAASLPRWEASALLDRRDIQQRPRQIISYSNHLNRGVPFRADMIDRDMVMDLATGPTGFDGLYQARIDYLFGDRSQEVDLFRARESLLGDIIHSAPTYIGAPQLRYPDNRFFGSASEPYSSFKNSAAKSRQGMVYVGANDGMLHGFNSDTGEEVMAYIPSFLASDEHKSGLHYLTDPDYRHRYFVDGIPTAADAYISNTANAPKEWRTVLAGGTGFGGKGVFLLDVTDPQKLTANHAADTVLWEFSYKDDPSMGYSNSSPVVSMMNNGQWSMVFGNGYNSATGKTSLFILSLEGGMDGEWSASDYRRIDLANTGGLSGVSVIDSDRNGTADRIYAGDLAGNLWVVDVSEAAASLWQTVYGNPFTPMPLFQATDVTGAAQPITATPTVSFNSHAGDYAAGSNLLVSFGTGAYLSVGDAVNADLQSFYTVWDKGEVIRGRNKLTRLSMQQRNATREVPEKSINWASRAGWVLDFNVEAGERVITKAIIRGDIVRFNTAIPESDPCKSGGDGWFMAIPLFGKSDRPGPRFDTNSDGVVSHADEPIEGIKSESGLLFQSSFLFDFMYTETSSGETDIRAVEKIKNSFRVGRLSWRQLVNDN